MKHIPFGRTGLTVSALGLGCMGMSENYGPSDDAESMATLARAVELGINFLDTADSYGPFRNEELIGRFSGEPARADRRGHQIRLRAQYRSGRTEHRQ